MDFYNFYMGKEFQAYEIPSRYKNYKNPYIPPLKPTPVVFFPF